MSKCVIKTQNMLQFTVYIYRVTSDSDVTSSYHIYASCFPPYDVGQAVKYLLLLHHFLSKIMIIRTLS